MNLPTICTVLVFANQFRLTGKAALFSSHRSIIRLCIGMHGIYLHAIMK